MSKFDLFGEIKPKKDEAPKVEKRLTEKEKKLQQEKQITELAQNRANRKRRKGLIEGDPKVARHNFFRNNVHGDYYRP